MAGENIYIHNMIVSKIKQKFSGVTRRTRNLTEISAGSVVSTDTDYEMAKII